MVSILTSAFFSKADIHERRSRLSPNVRYWPKADISGRLLGPKFGHSEVFGHLSVRLRPRADISRIACRT